MADSLSWGAEERGERMAYSLGEKTAQLMGSEISFVRR